MGKFISNMQKYLNESNIELFKNTDMSEFGSEIKGGFLN
jgi:hypothetical protein